MKCPTLPKKVRRELSADESLQRYFARERKWNQEIVEQQLRVLQVLQVRQGNRLLMITDIHRSLNGFIVEVK